jgi:hypothetical protein
MEIQSVILINKLCRKHLILCLFHLMYNTLEWEIWYKISKLDSMLNDYLVLEQKAMIQIDQKRVIKKKK